MQVELTSQEISIIQNALNAYWHDADMKLQQPEKLGILEASILQQSKELTYPLLMKFENII